MKILNTLPKKILAACLALIAIYVLCLMEIGAYKNMSASGVKEVGTLVMKYNEVTTHKSSSHDNLYLGVRNKSGAIIVLTATPQIYFATEIGTPVQYTVYKDNTTKWEKLRDGFVILFNFVAIVCVVAFGVSYWVDSMAIRFK